jgi:protein AFG1
MGEKQSLPTGQEDKLSGVLDPGDLRARWPEGVPKGEKEVDVRGDKPVLKEDHFWGVREDWGKKAGKWGKGASAFTDEKK